MGTGQQGSTGLEDGGETRAEALRRVGERQVTRLDADQLATLAHIFSARCTGVPGHAILKASMREALGKVGKAVPRVKGEEHAVHGLVDRASRAMGVPGMSNVTQVEQHRALLRIIGGDLC